MTYMLVNLMQFCCIILASAGLEDKINNLTQALKVAEWSEHKEIDLQSTVSYLNFVKQNLQIMLDYEIFQHAFKDTPFSVVLSEYLKRLDFITNNTSTTLIILNLLNADLKKQKDIELRHFCDVASIVSNYRDYLLLLSKSINFHISKSKNNAKQYQKLVPIIHSLETTDKANLSDADKMLFRGRVMEMTYHFCVQGLLAKIIWTVNHFYFLFDSFRKGNLKYRDDVLVYLSQVNPEIDENIIKYDCNEFFKIKNNLEDVYYQYTGKLFDFK